MNIRTITDASIEPVSLEEAKAHLRILHSDEDSHISRLITASRRSAEVLTNLSLASKVYEYRLDRFMPAIRLPFPPVQSVEWIKYKDKDANTHTLDPESYIAYLDRPAKIIPSYGKSFPSIELYPAGAVAIRYTAGYKTGGDDASLIIPEDIKQAILLLVADYYEYREDLLSRGHIPKTIPFGVNALLAAYKNFNF